jgi:hypothetical protein
MPSLHQLPYQCTYLWWMSFLRSVVLLKKVVGLERGPLSLVSATEELLDRKVAAPV